MTATVKGLWTKKELAEAHRLAEACHGDDAHWAFGDWLLAKEPIGQSSLPSGLKSRLKALSVEVGLSWTVLRKLRGTVQAWPPEHRVAHASYAAHERYRLGGPAAASERAVVLAAAPRNQFGKVITSSAPGCLPKHTNGYSLKVSYATYEAVAAEATATGQALGATAVELIKEALGARAWLAAEEAA